MATPIVQTATYTFQNTDELIAYQEGTFGSYEYGRYGNPTSRAGELKVRSRRATRASPRNARVAAQRALAPPPQPFLACVRVRFGHRARVRGVRPQLTVGARARLSSL